MLKGLGSIYDYHNKKMNQEVIKVSMNFSRNFVALRKKKGITQEKMAEQCGVSRGALAKWESGASIPNLYLVDDIAKYFDVKVDELLHGNMDPASEIGLEQLNDKIEKMKDEILSEIKKRGSTDLYQEYCHYKDELIEDDIPTDAYFYWGCEEAEKGHYDKALKYFEEAVARGDIKSIDSIMAVYRDILEIYADEGDDNKYWNCKLQMAKKMQECGKILENEIKSGRVF